MTVTYEIHPAIGVARVGSSRREDGYFVGPEPTVTEGAYRDGRALTAIEKTPARAVYRDSEGALLRQAARFRVFKVTTDVQGTVLTKEALAPDTRIQWSVRLANRKGVAPRFDSDLAGDRNDRDPECIVDSKLQRIALAGALGTELFGYFRQRRVTLGHAWLDAGWLYLLGGYGDAGAEPKPAAKTESVAGSGAEGADKTAKRGEIRELHYSDNDDWFDDTSDGPICARVLEAGQWQPVTPAWVIVGPPDFAPEIDSFITLHDVAQQAAIDMGAQSYPPLGATEFYKDVLPILERIRRYRWVNGPAIRAETQDRHARWSTDPAIKELADGSNAAGRKARKMLWAHLPVPPDLPKKLPTGYELPPQENRQVRMPRLYSHDGESKDGVLPLLPYQYLHMFNWQHESFGRDRAPSIEFPCDALDRIALESCSGGPFFPGIEAPAIMRNRHVYASAFRLKQKGDGDPNKLGNADPAHPSTEPDARDDASDFPGLVAGQVTQGLAIPWQADFFYCQQGRDNAWWPASRPDDVFHEQHPPKVVVDSLSDWTVRWDDNVENGLDMVTKWSALGIVRRIEAVRAPDVPIGEFTGRNYEVQYDAQGVPTAYFYYGETDRRLPDSPTRIAHFPKAGTPTET